MSEREKIIEKIKKLLRMKRGGAQAEIETALAMAAELARKYNIDIENIDPDTEPPQPIGHIDAVTSARIQWECKYAALVVQQFFNVNVLIRRADRIERRGWRYCTDFHLTFVGRKFEIEIAVYVYRFLVGSFRRAWISRENRRLQNRRAFLYGMYHGLCAKLDEQQQKQVNRAALILIFKQVKVREEYMSDRFGKIGSESAVPDCDANASKWAGYQAGRDVQIRTGLTKSGKATLALT